MRRRILKWATLLAVLVMGLVGLYWIYLYKEIRYVAAHDDSHQAEAIVVLGAAQYNGRPSKVLKARLDHALDLYKKGYAKAIITTGSYGPDPNFSEAQVAKDYLTSKGADPLDIITDQASLTTHDSIRAASRVIRSNSWTSARVVSDGFHL